MDKPRFGGKVMAITGAAQASAKPSPNARRRKAPDWR